MMKKLPVYVSLLFMANTIHAAEITVFAAASLTDALEEISANFQAQTGNRVTYNFGGSGALERQIEHDAAADVFVSADEAKVDDLEKKGLLLAETRRSFLSNTLVVITRADYDRPLKSAADLASADRIALADPASVPAGIYARQYLEKAGLWKNLEPKIVPAENVRAAMAAVESGNADAAIVYKTDAALAKKAKVALEIPVADGPKISYALAVLKSAPQLESAKQFAEFLTSEKSQAVFKKYGFLILQTHP
jgi:molybdate transport system substrate-binding protein